MNTLKSNAAGIFRDTLQRACDQAEQETLQGQLIEEVQGKGKDRKRVKVLHLASTKTRLHREFEARKGYSREIAALENQVKILKQKRAPHDEYIMTQLERARKATGCDQLLCGDHRACEVSVAEHTVETYTYLKVSGG